MSYRFDKSEVPQFEHDPNPPADYSTFGGERYCVACRDPFYLHGSPQPLDRTTGLCRPCWRIVILGPTMESWLNTP